ncbi:E3 ubiquitin-protein ligase E3D [Coemansia sp. RSA 922]|nr:E3 ubiquitin-protein ligase E3D [Coemansia sp. RSA 922]
MTAYYMEVLDSLKVVDIYVECARSRPKSGGSDIQLVGTTELQISTDSVIGLPVTVSPRAAARSSLEDPESGSDANSWIRIRVPVALDCMKARLEQASQLITSIEKPITASAIQGLVDVDCQSCSSSLFANAPGAADCDTLRIRDLPSAFWSELVDCWVCHPEKDTVNVNTDLLHEFEPKLAAATDSTQDSIRKPEPSTETKISVDMWVGDTYVLASEDLFKDLPKTPVHMDTKVLSFVVNAAYVDINTYKGRFYNSYTELCCDSCSNVVGEVGRMGSRKMAKLCLSRVRFVLPSPRSSISVSLSQAVSREILSHVGAHAVYRFVVEGRKACRPVALINVVGWNAEIRARAVSSAQPDNLPDTSGRYIKILFTQKDSSAFDTQASQWLDDNATELISLLDADADSLLRILAENSRLLPPPLRGMSNMTRSFLQM